MSEQERSAFADTDFRVYDEKNPTKRLKIECSDIPANTTRIIKPPLTDGTLALGTDIPEVFPDDTFRVQNASDNSKEVALDVSGVTTGNTRTLIVPDQNGTIAVTTDIPTTFTDNNFRVQDNTDLTKQVALEVSGVTTGTTRTLTVPDQNGTIALTSDVIGPEFDDSLFTLTDNLDPTKRLKFDAANIPTASQITLSAPSSGGLLVTETGALPGYSFTTLPGTLVDETTLYYIRRIGRTVKMSQFGNVQAFSGISAPYISSPMPTVFRPSTDLRFLITVEDQGNPVQGLMIVRATGVIEFYASEAEANFQTGGTTGIYNFGVAWCVP